MKIVFDLCGTLADATHRQHLIRNTPRGDNPEAWDRFFRACIDDPPIAPIVTIYKALRELGGHTIELWTGRSEVCRPETEHWCAMHLGEIPTIRMRPEGERRLPDVLLKHKWLRELIADGVPLPELVFEDRAKTIQMFRDHGIQAVAVADSRY